MLLLADPAPAAIFSGPFRDETLKGISRPGQPEVFAVLELTSETAGNLFLSESGISGPDATYVPKILRWDSVTLSVNERSNDAASIEIDVTIADEFDQGEGRRVFDAIDAGYRNRFRGAAAAIKLLSPNISSDNAVTLFRGVVDSFIKTDLAEWTIRLRTDDKALNYSEAPRVPFARYFKDLHPDFEATYAAVIYGEHSGLGLPGRGGAVRLSYVDTVLFSYCVGLGKYTVTAVYIPDPGDTDQDSGDDFRKIADTEYVVTYPIIGGKQFTLVTFTDNQGGTEGATEIRADVQGLGSTGGDGFLGDWTNPAWQLLHYLANFCFGDWRSGAYIDPGSLPLDQTSFADAAEYFTAFGYESSKVLRDPTGCDSTVNEWAESVNCKVFWDQFGRLAIAPIDLRPPRDLYDAEFWLRASEEAISISLPTDATQTVQRISYSKQFLEAEGKYLGIGSVSDISVPEKVRQTRALAWSAAKSE